MMAKKDETTNTGYSNIEEGFLYKPVSERGSLVILLPSQYRDSKVSLKTPDGKVLEQGVSHGYANGNREHFRFSGAGNKYPNGAVVEITRSDGSVIRHQIANTSARYDVGGSSGSSSGTVMGATALGMIGGGGTSNFQRPSVSSPFSQKEETFSYKSPLSVLESIRSISNIVSGSAKNFNRMVSSFAPIEDTALVDFFESRAQETEDANSTLTPIPTLGTRG